MHCSTLSAAPVNVVNGLHRTGWLPDGTIERSLGQTSPEVVVVTRQRTTSDDIAAIGSRSGWIVRCESSADSVRDALTSREVDLLLIDLPLPCTDARSLCRELQSVPALRILVLTPSGNPDERISLLENGADDCLEKPYKPAELTARMGALLRRSAMSAKCICYDVGDILVDPMKRDVTVADRPVRLREKEFDLLLELARRAGSVVTRQTLLERVWGLRDAMASDTLDVHIHRLRQKLGDLHADRRRIETVWGVGYRLCV
ncbi:MAG TPA: winged helix-turn-helix domain-containing protein [Chloroflexota bacterium]